MDQTMPSAITSRSVASVEKITAIYDIKIENIEEKLSREVASRNSGNFDIQIHDTEEEEEEGNGKYLFTWDYYFYREKSELNLETSKPQKLPVIATVHVLKKDAKVWTSYTLRESDLSGYYLSFNLKDVRERIEEFVDEDGSLTIRLEIILLPCCLSVTEQQEGYEGLKDTPVTKRAEMEAHSLATFGQKMASMRTRFTDLTITCQGENFQVHRAVLSAHSEVSIIILINQQKPST